MGTESTSERELFDAILRLSGLEQDERLNAIAQGNPDLASRLRRLLAAHQVLGPDTLGTFDSSGTPIPEQIGPYRIEGVLGEGGMGVVYRALQTEPVRRRVALKVIRSGLDSRQVLARFLVERQALAFMEHPGIAKVLEAAETETGAPYFVMELVDGTPINQFARTERLSIRDRVRLVAKLCHAVQHAHQKGVIHRDLKPSNVLVERHPEGPVPKVIDFGVAKAVAGPLSGTTVLTQAQQALGTPAYMSPEQAGVSGLDVDTRSDVFSIGVILYELLCGKLPLDISSLTYGEFMRRLATHIPVPPSSQSPREDAREVKGDLDAITLKALHPDRDRRYETALAMAQDLEHFLEDEPVSARTPAMGYWFTALARRYRPQLMAAGVGLAAIVLGAVLALFGLVRAQRAEKEATQKAEAAAAVSEFLVSLFDAADPTGYPRGSMTVRELVDRGSLQVEERLSSQPSVRSQVLETLSRVYHSLGIYDRAAGLADASSAAAQDEDQLATALLRGAAARQRLAQFDAAEQALQKALEIQERRLGPEHVEVGRTLLQLGGILWQRDRLDEAISVHRRAARILEASLGPEDVETARAMRGLGIVLSELDRTEEALKNYKHALAVFEKTLGAEHPLVADTLDSIGIVHLNLEKPDASRPYFERAVGIRTRALGPDHPVTAYSHLNIGRMHSMQHNVPEALRSYERALEIRKRSLGEKHPAAADVMGSLATLNLARGNLREARQLLENAREIYTAAYSGRHVDLAVTLRDLAEIEVREGRRDNALRLLREAAQAGSVDRLKLDDAVFDSIRQRPEFRSLGELK